MPKATQILRQDHRKVAGLFRKCEQANGREAKRRCAVQAMNELEVHAKLEEEIFYPAVRKAIEERELVDEAKQEHQEVKSLIRQIEKAQRQDGGPGDEFEGKVSELQEAVQHHVEEEEGEMFPKVENSALDLTELAAQMVALKKQLMQQMGKGGGRSRRASKAKSETTRRRKSRRTRVRKSSSRKRSRAS